MHLEEDYFVPIYVEGSAPYQTNLGNILFQTILLLVPLSLTQV